VVRAGQPPAGTGPYRIRSWRPDGGAILEAFEGYHRGPARIAEVVFEVVPQPYERLQRLRDGSAQLAADVIPGLAHGEAAAPRIVSRADGLRVAFLTFDVARERSPYTSAVRNPFRDRRVRQAVALAINRPSLLRLLAGRAALAEQITTSQELGAYHASVPSRPFDREGARRLLAAAGFGQGFEVALDLADDSDSRAVSRAIAADLADIGLAVRLRPQSDAELARRVEARDTALCLRSWTSETGDGRSSYESLLHTTGTGLGLANAGGYSNPALDRMLREVAAPLEADQRRMLLARLATKVALDVPIVPLYSMADVYGVVSRLRFEPRLDGQIRAAEMRWAS
jgi:peptide/nickel transport system substrate-binding protein